MKILLISPHPDILAFGVRSISAYINKSGIAEAHLMFLPYKQGDLSRTPDFCYPYPDRILEQVAIIAREYDLVGISLMTNYYHRACQLTEVIRHGSQSPIIWGGLHPTVASEQCLQHADYLIKGEGERSMVQLLEKLSHNEPVDTVPNLVFKASGRMQENELAPLLSSEEIPQPDWEWSQHYILWKGQVRPMTLELIHAFLADNVATRQTGMISYQTMATRGCPHGCAYCCNSILRQLYKGQKYVRRRPLNLLIKELTWVKENLPFVSMVDFQDDSFSAGSEDEIRRFAELYSRDISLPFTLHVSPLTITPEIMDLLVSAGLRGVVMGIQSASEKTLETYKRSHKLEKVQSAAYLLNQYKNQIYPPFYDIIVDNPFEEKEEQFRTLQFLLTLPRPFRLRLFSLVLFPGTLLYIRACEEGMIIDPVKQIFQKHYHVHKDTYYKFLLALLSDGWPRMLIRIALWRPIRFLLDGSLPGSWYRYIYKVSLIPVLATRLGGLLLSGKWKKLSGKLQKRIRRRVVLPNNSVTD